MAYFGATTGLAYLVNRLYERPLNRCIRARFEGAEITPRRRDAPGS